MIKWLIVLLAAIVVLYICLPRIYSFRGLAAYGKGEEDEALKLYEKAYKTGRASVKAKINYALIALKAAQLEQAEKIFDEIIVSPKIKEEQKKSARQYRCMAYIKQNKSKQALDEAMELLEVYKTSDLYAIAGYAMALEGEDADKLLAFCTEAYEYNADNRDIADNYAVALIKAGEYTKAVEICGDIIEKYEDFPEGHFHKAQALTGMGRFDMATEELELLDKCNFKYMTTVSEKEIEQLKKYIREYTR